MRFRLRQSLTIAGWSFLWIVLFWAFLLVGFPRETARNWLSERLGQSFDARVSIEELHIAWNLAVRLKGVSIAKQASEAGPAPAGESKRDGEVFMIRLDSVTVDPRLSGLISVDPKMDFRGNTSSGGTVSGSYTSGELTLFFRDLSSRDVTIATLPVPSSAIISGSGRLKLVATNGTIDTEVDGVPGGRQSLKLLGGAGPGLDGRLKITVSLPKPRALAPPLHFIARSSGAQAKQSWKTTDSRATRAVAASSTSSS